MKPSSYIDVDTLQAQTSLAEAADKCGFPLDVHGSGREVRLDCLFGCPGDHAGKREIAVNTGNPQKVFCCHAYGCQFRGNLLTLMHGMLTGAKPTGDKLTGGEFSRVRKVLAGTPEPEPTRQPQSQPAAQVSAPTPLRNVPLADSDNPKARDLVDLSERLIMDVAHMPPAAASYVRRHPCLTSPELLRKWSVGVLPTGGEDKRGWSLRGHVVYPIHSEDGKLLAWIARDPGFEEKERAFLALTPDQRSREKPPHKHKVPTGFHRGLELFGQQASRLQEPGYREILAHCGPIIVEGFNDVLALDQLGIPAVAIMSNRITVEQVDKIERWSRQLANGRASLLFDADGPGDEGTKEALWLLAERNLDVRLCWSRGLGNGQFSDWQPESLSCGDWEQAIRPRIWRL
ncbi:MAG: toprim domain-containing protein [Planctomycetaceae bacterium]|nr:toprim domain-containing protein [Planctomycetaceae bacterium]